MENIVLTAAAVEAAKNQYATNAEHTGKSLRLYLDGKGCDGFFYGVTFDQAEATDLHFLQHDIDVIVDPETIEFVHGSTIDWVDDERGRGFLVDNPRHSKFRGKFYKRPSWQAKFTSRTATP